MEGSPLAQWLGSRFEILLRDGRRVQGVLTGLVPEQYLTLNDATLLGTGHTFEQFPINADQVSDIIPLLAPQSQPQPANDSFTPPAPTLSSAPAPSVAVPFSDPAILSMSRFTELPAQSVGSLQHQTQPNTTEKQDLVIVPNPADRLTYYSPDESDTTTTAPATTGLAKLTISPPNPAMLETTEEEDAEKIDLTPTASTARGSRGQKDRRRGKRAGKRGQASAPTNEGAGSPAANHGKGWRQTPILQSNKSFQPFASLRKGQSGQSNQKNAENGWASEDVTDVQEAGDFDFLGSLAKFDKRTIFNEMREQDKIDEASRLVSHNRLPRPKPGTAGGKNLHYTENVLDIPPNAASKLKETPGDFWKSEADDDHVNAGEVLSSREGSGRNSRMRGESRVSTNRRSQSRKASTTANAIGGGAGPSRANSGQLLASSKLEFFYTVPSNRRIDTVTHFQMLNVENIAHSDLGLTEDLMTENAGRSIAQVALRALDDPANKLRIAANSSSASPPTIVVLAGNNKSGIRAIAAARHLRNRSINVLVCVVGIDRETDLLEDIRKQIRIFRSFGGLLCTKAELFEHLTKSATTLSSSSQVSITLILDALLGLYISFEELRTPDQAITYELMEWANRNEAFVLAIDIPSGIEPSSGKVNIIDGAELYIHPRYVVSLGAPKQGLLRAIETRQNQEDMSLGDHWKLYLADIGLGTAAWRKAATKIRRGIDFDDQWVLELQYQHPLEDN
ncbi:YjeF-related protein N-terminus-domain-containing protein [Xylariaceae sp. FL0016]|nr:YjeF-related protein N-terminus-domain-containing protein [Xylariaceae sp. FL0016]